MELVAIVLTAVGWLVNALLRKGVTALLEGWAKRVGLGKELATFKQELMKIEAMLETAQQYQTTNNALLEMLKDLQQLAYQADDLLDELDYYRIKDDVVFNGGISSSQVADSASPSTSSSSGFKSASRAFLSAFKQVSCSAVQDDIMQLPLNIPSKSKISHRMKDLVQQLQKSGENFRSGLMLETTVVANQIATVDNRATTTNPRETTSHMTEKVYGRDQERDHLIELLVGDEASNQALSIVAIIGQGGIGKTTLARLVYNDQRLKDHFDLQMWVTVSDNFDVKRFTHEILESANYVPNQEFRNLDNLHSALMESLGSKRFLLVLDDLWEVDDRSWKLLMAPLRKSPNKGSVVLITTRMPGVVNLDRTIKRFNLGGLEENEFWSLFKTCSFGKEMHEGNGSLEYIGFQIAEKLKGNPLAARTVGPLLNKNLDEKHWRQVLESNEWNDQNGMDHIIPALELSYKHLPDHLKRCFSYCATFPRDHKFKQGELIRLWLAQNFLDSKVKGKRMEDIGEEYLQDLINYGFVEKVIDDYWLIGRVQHNYYVIHDLLHDLAQKVSLGECLNADGKTDSITIKSTVRHLSITKNSENELNILKRNLDPLKLSTIYFLGDNIYGDDMDPATLESFQNWSKDATVLRVLRLRGIPNPQPLLRGVANFTHLRYLKLSYNYSCNTLPKGICQLYHLQVLDVKKWPNLVKLPYRFNNLVNLRHFIVQKVSYGLLRNQQSLHSLIPGIGKLAHLQKLEEFVVGNKREFEVAQLKELRELRGRLRILDLQNVMSKEEAKCAGLIEKTFLDELNLSWHNDDWLFTFGIMFRNVIPSFVYDAEAEVLEGLQPHHNLKILKIDTYGGATSPTWLASNTLYNLEEVTLVCCYAWENLPPLGQLRNLKRLKLYRMQAVKEIGPHLYGSTNSDYHVAFQCLELLDIYDMPSLEKWIWSDRCQSFLALTELQISECPKLLLTYFSLNGTEINRRFPHLQKFHSQLKSWTPLQPMVQMHPLPFSARISDMHINNLGSFQEIKLHELGLTICNPRTPTAWDDISFIDMKCITSLEIKSNQYLISWETLCDLICLQSLKISESPVLFSFLTKGHKSKKCFQLHSLTEISFYSCGITGKELSFLICCAPKLSSLIVNQCPSIKSIKVDTRFHNSDFESYHVMNFGEDEGLLRIPSSLAFLRNLRIENCPDLEFVSNSGFSPLVSLLSVAIRGCNRLLSSMIHKQSIRAGYLLRPRPRELSIHNAPDGTSWLPYGLYSLLFNNFDIISGGYPYPPGLQELSIDNVPEGTSQLLSGLCSLLINNWAIIRRGYPLPPGSQELHNESEMISQFLFGLHSLDNLEITSGGYLLPPGLRELSIDNAPEGTSQLLSGLYSLKSLEIIDSPELVSLDLSFCLLLNKLNLNNCQGLGCLKGLGNLALSQPLEVKCCPTFADAWIVGSNEQVTMLLQQLVTDDAAILAMPICRQLTYLFYLSFTNLNTANLTEEQEEALLLLTSLKFLSFYSSPNLCHLPATLHLHPSIEILDISFCPNIKPFPERSLPKKLTELTVLSCNPEVERLSMEYRKHLDKRRRP